MGGILNPLSFYEVTTYRGVGRPQKYPMDYFLDLKKHTKAGMYDECQKMKRYARLKAEISSFFGVPSTFWL